MRTLDQYLQYLRSLFIPVVWFLAFNLLGVRQAAGQNTNADLVLGFSSAPNEASAGQYFRFTISVYNATVCPATNVVVTDLLPANARFVEASASQGAVTPSARAVSCAFGTVNYNQTVSLTIELQTTAPGSITNAATVTADTPDPDVTNNTAAWVVGVTQARFYGVGLAHAGYGTPPMAILTNNQVFVTGQWLGKTCDLYTMSTRTFSTPAGTMIAVHALGTATRLTNGLVLLAGGANCCGTKTSELYIPNTQTFQQVGDMLGYAYGFTSTLEPDGTVLLCGLSNNELYTPGTQNFTYAPSLTCPVSGLLLPNGKYLQFSYGYANLYDPVTQTTTPAAGFQQPRAYQTATLLPNGKVLVAGGQGTWGATYNTLDSSEIYDSASNTFTWGANLTGPREYHSAMLLPDGTVLLAGGITAVNGQYNPLIGEIYDPNGATNVPGIIVSDASVIQPPSGSNYLNFNVSLTMTSSLPVTVQYATSDGTASANGNSFTQDVGDYVAVTGTVTFPPGSTNQVVPVPVLGTGMQELTETMYLNLSVPSQAWMARAIATGFILNTNPAPAIAITPVTILQGDSGLSNAVFNVFLSASSLSNISVDYFTSDQTATAGANYLATTGTLNFSPGVTNLAISVPVIGGLVPEPTKTFLVTLTNPQNATIAVNNAVGTILNIEGTPGRLDHFAWSAIPGLQTQTIGFPVTITALDHYGNAVTNLPWPVRLSAQTTNVMATNLDFEMPGLAPWTPFDTTGLNHPEQQVLYDVAGLGQPSTAYRTIAGGGTNGLTQNIWLAGGISYTFSANFAAQSIGYDESCFGANVYLQVGPTNVYWATPNFCGSGTGNGSVKFTYTPPTNGLYPIQIYVVRDFYYGDSVVVYADDVQIAYPLISPTLVTNFTNGVWSGIIVPLQSGAGVRLLANDNDGHQGASNPFAVTATTDIGLSGSSQILGLPPLRTGMQLVFSLAVTNRGPAAAVNTLVTSLLPGNVSYVSATNSQGVVAPTGGGGLQWAIGLLPAGSNATATIVLQANLPGAITNVFALTNFIQDLNLADNQIAFTNLISPPLLSIAGASGAEAAATATGMVFSVTLSGASGQAVSANYFTADGTATHGVDYAGTNGTVTVSAGATNATIIVFALDDGLNKPNRTFSISLTNAVNSILSVSNATGTIMNDNPPPVVWIGNTTKTKPDSGSVNANFPVNMNKPAIYDVLITYRTQDGSATNGVDYVGTTYDTITIPAGSTNANLAVAIIGNTTYHTNRTFSVVLTSSSNSTLGTNQAVGTIISIPVAGRLDHFVFDPIPSPQYNSVAFPVTIRGVDYLGAPATNFGYFSGTTVLMAQSAQYYTNYFSANFEDGTLSGWTNSSSPGLLASNLTDWAAGSAHSVQLSGRAAQSGASFGLRHAVSNCLPTGISFYVRVAQTNAQCGRFTAYGSAGYNAVDFYQNRDGRIGLSAGNGFVGVLSLSNHWFRVDLTLDWTRHVVAAMSLDGTLVATNVAFPISGPWVDTVAVQNSDSSTSWFDEINLYGQYYTNFTVSPINTSIFDNGSWTGNVTVLAAATNAWLSTTDSFSHFGQSATFNLLQPNAIQMSLPASIVEGMGTLTGKVSVLLAATQASTIFLTSSLPARLTVPGSVVLPAGQTNASFPLTVIDDALLNGPQNVLVSAGATNLVAGSAISEVDDNESAVLSLGLPSVESENAGPLVSAGHVYASAAPARPVAINLASGNAAALTVPSQVVLPAGATSTVFTITMVDNHMIEGTRYVPVTGSFANWTPATNFITVLDSENTNLMIAGPALVSKGDPPTTYTLGVDGFLTNNLTVALSSTDTNRLVVPPTATIIAGTTSVVFQASIVNDHLYNGSETVALSATAAGFTGITTNVLVLDNMVHHFDFVNVPGAVTSTVPFQIIVAARDIYDGPILVDNETLTLSAAGSGSPILLQPTNITLVSGVWTGSVTVATAEPQVTLRVMNTNGVTGQSTAITVVPPVICLLNINAADLVYSPVSQRLWALVSSNGTLVPINPLLCQSEAAVPVGPGSVQLASSGDGTYVHIANNANTPAVRRFNTLTLATDLAITNQGYSVEDLKAMPGNSSCVAVAWYQPGYSPYGRGVLLYDNGIARTNGGGGNEIEWAESSNRLYGYNFELSSYDFWLMNVDASGLTIVKDLPFINYSTTFTCAGGLVFAHGGIYDPERGIRIGATSGGAFAGSSAAGRYWQFDSSPGRLTAFDLATLLPIGTTYLTGVSNVAGKLIPWGNNGLAFRANSGQVAIARTSLVPSGPPADLALTAAAGLPATVSNSFTCTVTVSNLGPNIATNVVLAQTLPVNSMLNSVSGGGAWTQANGGLVFWVSNLVSGARATIKLTLTGTNPGLATLIASATSDTTDPDRSNNVARLNISVGSAPGPDTVTVVSQVTSDIAWNTAASRLVASVPNAQPALGNSLLSLNPLTGVFDPPIPTSTEPDKLAVSANGQYVYAGLDADNSIQRVDFSNRVADLKFPTGYDYVNDLAVLPDDPHAVVATAHTTLSVYDDGVPRPNAVGATEYNQDYFLALASPSNCYATYPTGFRQILINTNGANLVSDTRNTVVTASDWEIHYGAGRMFTPGGRVFDPVAGTNIATVPYSGLVAPDATDWRVFYLTGSGNTWSLVALDITNLTLVSSLTISNISGSPTRLIRWGTDGLAFRTTGGQIFLIRTTMADDRNHDGLPDSWQIQYFGSINAVGAGPNDNPAGDGFTNLQKYRAGLNPLVFYPLQFTQAGRVSGGGFQMTVLGNQGASYELMASSDLISWSNLLTFTSTNIPTVITDLGATNSRARFYRVTSP